MRSGVLIILFGIAGLAPMASADLLVVRQDLVEPGTGRRLEVTSFVTEDPEDRQEVLVRLRKSLAEDRAKNPKLLVGFEETILENDRKPSAEDPVRSVVEKVAGESPIHRRTLGESVQKALKFRYPDEFLKNSRVIFTVARFTLNSVVSTWGLFATQHLPFEVALTAGVLTGAMSAGFQWYNEKVQGYLTKSLFEKFANGRVAKEATKTVESLFRWYLMEIGFVTVVETVLTLMGHAPTGTLSHVVTTGLFTAAGAVLAQGTWDFGVALVTKRQKALAKTARELLVIRTRSDFITLGLSAFAVLGMIGKIAHLPFGDTVFWGMGLTGGAYLVKAIHQEWKCLRGLRKAEPAKPEDPLSSPPPGVDSGGTTAARAFPLPRYSFASARLNEA